MNANSRPHSPEKILNIKIHKSEISAPNAVDTKENTKSQDQSKEEPKSKLSSNNVTGRENNGGVDPQAWIRD